MWAPTDGEINLFWSFIQGSIVTPETWNALLRSYGFCERHAWIHIGIEMSFRDQYLLGPTILYAELVEKALRDQYTAIHGGTRTSSRRPLLPLRHGLAGCDRRCLFAVRLARGRDAGTCEILQVDYSRCGLFAFAPIVQDKQGL